MIKLKLAICTCLAFITLLFSFTSVSASEGGISTQITSNHGLYNYTNNEYYVFANEADRAYFAQLLATKSERSYNPIRTREKFIKNISVGRKWVGYNPLTPNWSPTDRYNITATYNASVSGSFDYSGVKYSISAGVAKGVVISVPANSKRYSRLGFEVDVQLKEYKIEVYDTSQRNKIIRTMYVKRPVVINTYNVVRYK